jgi:ribosomal protein S18 acetylase RimI-like enzyme
MVYMVEVRRLTSNDAAQLWQLRLIALESEPQAFRETAAEHRQKPVTYFFERLGETDSNGFVYGAFDGAALIGMAGYYRKDEKRAWIWGVFVSPQYRGSGISQALLEALLNEIRSVPRITSVHLTVALTQKAARRLYHKCGFRLSRPDLDTPPNEEHLTYLLEK